MVTVESLLAGEGSEEAIKGLSFEQGLKLLEELVAIVESGSLPLDRAVTSYERGTALLQHLRSQLSGAEERLRILQKE